MGVATYPNFNARQSFSSFKQLGGRFDYVEIVTIAWIAFFAIFPSISLFLFPAILRLYLEPLLHLLLLDSYMFSVNRGLKRREPPFLVGVIVI